MIDLNIFKSDKKLLKEIHTSFHTSGERLVNEARALLETATSNNMDKRHDLLLEAGFSSSEVVKQIKDIKHRTTEAQDIMACYNNMQGMYKVITLQEIVNITEKYKLCMGKNAFYKGDVPDKNLQDILRFKKQVDGKINFNSQSMRICAFQNDFTDNAEFDVKEGVKVKKFTLIERKDPIVLYPCRGTVSYNRNSTILGNRSVWEDRTEQHEETINEKYWYVVTAWGPEASDPKIINQKFN